MPMTPLGSDWYAPADVSGSLPRYASATTELRTRSSRTIRPTLYGSSSYNGLRYRRARYSMLDAETSRFFQISQEQWNINSQDELFAPRPARVTLQDLRLVGAIFERSNGTTFLVSCSTIGCMLRDPRCSVFVVSHGLARPQARGVRPVYNNAGSASLFGEYSHDDQAGPRQHTGTQRTGMETRQVIRPRSDYSNNDYEHSIEELESSGQSHPSRTHNLRPPAIDEFPDLFYAYKPLVYHEYKYNCSRTYKDFNGFIRHSLERHKRQGNFLREGIMDRFQAARDVRVPAWVPKEQRNAYRYLLVREQLFGTPFTDTTPRCENEGQHPIIPGKRSSGGGSSSIGNGKRPRSRTTSPGPRSRARSYLEQESTAESTQPSPRRTTHALVPYTHLTQIPVPGLALPSGGDLAGRDLNSRGWLAHELQMVTTGLNLVHGMLPYEFPSTTQDTAHIAEFRTALQRIQQWTTRFSAQVSNSRQRFFESIDMSGQTDTSFNVNPQSTPTATQFTPSASISLAGDYTGYGSNMTMSAQSLSSESHDPRLRSAMG